MSVCLRQYEEPSTLLSPQNVKGALCPVGQRQLVGSNAINGKSLSLFCGSRRFLRRSGCALSFLFLGLGSDLAALGRGFLCSGFLGAFLFRHSLFLGGFLSGTRSRRPLPTQAFLVSRT